MEGVGVPLVTPFRSDGTIAGDKLKSVASWVVDQGVDFIVPCGSNGESELMTLEERAQVIEIITETVSVPVLAGTGHPGLVETLKQTERAASAGAEGALVVTPFYFGHDQSAFERYYTRVAEESEIPVYLYNVAKMTGTRLTPETVASLSDHDNIHGLKDSTADMIVFQQEKAMSNSGFEVFIGSGSLFAQGLDVEATGGIMALANVVPELTAEILEYHRSGDKDLARNLGSDLVELNQAITAQYGIPGVKAAMHHRGVPAGHVRAPHTAADPSTVEEIQLLVDDALD